MFPLHSQIKNETTAMNWYKRLTLYSAALASVLLPGACSDEGPLDDAIPASGDAISFGIVSGRSSRAADASGAQSAAGSGTQSAAAPAAQPDDRFVLRSSETADSLCVRTAVSDFPASAADTRATLVTAAEFYNTFHVLAHWKANGTWVDSFFYMDVDVNKSGDVWGTAADDPYYWPGAQHALKFYAYAPADAPFTKPAKPSDGLTLGYTVDPANAASQRDLVVATTAETPGDYNQPQELQFRHICTAVRFAMGSDLQPGKYTKVELTGVRNNGTYDLETGKWTLDATTGDFTQSFAEGSATTDGTTPSGTAITPDGEATFMMLPQELPAGAKIKVTFHDDVTGTDRSVEASLAGRVWPEGKQVTYTLTVQPGFKFELSELPTIDAHYTIHKTTLKVSGVAADKTWTVTADKDVSIIRQEDMNDFAKLGFWTDRLIDENGNDLGSARGEPEFSGSGSGDIPIALFIPENAGDLQRTIRLKIKFDDYTEEQVAVDPIELTQLCPAWTSDGFGWEQKQDATQGAYGFYWTRLISYQLVYSSDRTFGGANRQQFCNAVIAANKNWDVDAFAKTQNFYYENAWTTRYCITLDYSKLNDGVTTDRTQGLNNTITLAENAAGAASMAFENTLITMKKTEAGHTEEDIFRAMTESDLFQGIMIQQSVDTYGPKPGNIDGSAAIAEVLKKNRYDLREKKDNVAGGLVSYAPVIEAKDIVWFLPAVDQFSVTFDTSLYPNFEAIDKANCWSSTAIAGGNSPDNYQAYLGNGSAALRKDRHLIRACRNKQ